MSSTRFAILVLAMGIFLLGCTQPPNDRIPVYIGQEFELKGNETAHIESESLDLSIRDIDDSRCPSDVSCVQAGQVNVKVVLTKEGDLLGFEELVQSGDETPSVLVGFPQARDNAVVYNVTLVGVVPYPKSTDALTLGDYTVTLRIDRT